MTGPSIERLRVAYVLRAFPRLSETFILNEILGLRRLGVEIRIYPLELLESPVSHPAAEELRPHVVPVPSVANAPISPARSTAASRQRASWQAGGWIGRQIAAWGAHHVHAHFAGPAAGAAARAASVAGVSFTFTAHAKDIFVDGVDWPWLGELASSAHRVITVCEFNRRHLESHLPSSASVLRLYNGVDLSLWTPSRPHARWMRARPFRLLAVGRLVRKKGFHVLLDAVARLRRRGERISLLVVGEGVERAALEAQVKRLRLGRWVRFAGPQAEPEVRHILRGSDLVALPCVVEENGNQDALPTVLLEAAACAIPAVATPVGGIPEIIAHGRTGLLVPENNVAALAAAISSLGARPGLRRRMGRAARRHALRRFGLETSAAALASVFAAASAGREAKSHAHRAALP